MGAFSCKNAVFAALAAAILLIGTATGSATAMFAISAIALALMMVFCRTRLTNGGPWVALVGAVAAVVIGMAIAMVLTLR